MLIVIDGDKVFCRILGMMHMTRKIASEEQDESMADIEPNFTQFFRPVLPYNQPGSSIHIT